MSRPTPKDRASTARALLGLAAFAALFPAARAGEPAIVAKARAYLGSEAVLDAVGSVHMTGTFTVTFGPRDSALPSTSSVDIVFQKPWSHRLIERTGKVVRTVALDGYDAWELREDPSDPRSPRLMLYGPDAIRALRADAWENLDYYRGLDAAGVAVKDEGPATIDGVACEKVAFVHDPDLVYTRYFDRDTGRLVHTETADHAQVREEGSQVVGGIRFARKIVTVQKLSSARTQTTVLTLDRITLNERFPEGDFATPLPPMAPTASAPPAMALPRADTSPAPVRGVPAP